ncbi:MAG: seg [archaeon GW2011_AR5]|nr:MAG: seg [archaeon GW2011_AR5]
MKVDIKSENYNKFLKRKELEVTIEHPEEATPSTAALQQVVAKQTGAPADKTEIKEIFSALGAATSKGLVFVWDEKTVKDLSKKEEAPAAAEPAPPQPAE